MLNSGNIKELEKEVAYWRNLALGFEQDSGSTKDTSKNVRDSVARLGAQIDPLKTDSIQLNFYESFPYLLTKGIVSVDIGPFAMGYVLFTDPYISIFLRYVSQTPYRKTLNAYLGEAPDSNQVFDPSSVFEILNLNPKALGEMNPIKEKKINAFIERINTQNKSNTATFKSELFSTTLSTITTPRFIEDKCLYGQYSPVLLACIGKIQCELPSLPDVKLLLNNFYHHIYPLMPCIDIDLLEEIINEVIQTNLESPGRISVNLGTTNIKLKLLNISILYLILTISISHMKLRFFDQRAMQQDTEHKYDADREWIERMAVAVQSLPNSAAELVSILNIYQSRTEETVSWHILLWIILAHEPDLCSVFNDSSGEGVIGMIGPLISDLGLHTDPSEYVEPTGSMKIDSRYKNYRRKLWMCYGLISRFEVTVKGKTPKKSAADIETMPGMKDRKNGREMYCSLCKQDMSEENEAELAIIGLIFDHLQFMAMFIPYDKLFKDNFSSLSLTEVDRIYGEINNCMEKEFKKTNDNPAKWVHHQTIDYSYNASDVESILVKGRNLMGRSVKITICNLLTGFFNSQRLHDAFDLEECLLYCQRALIDSCEAAAYLTDYFGILYNENIRTTGKYFANRISQILLSRCSLHISSSILRVDHLLGLSKRRSNQQSFLYEDQIASSNINVINKQRRQCVQLRTQLFSVLENLNSKSSEELRYNYISGFRHALLTDCGSYFLKQNANRFLMRDILMSNIFESEEAPGYMGTGIHLLSTEEKENMLLAANEFVHFDHIALQLLVDTVSSYCKTGDRTANVNTSPKHFSDFTGTSSNVLIKDFNGEMPGNLLNFEFGFGNNNLE
ncbi:unnamed protein product [Kluyveromyces dobzhanskii CBS 2104]|uniref:WGS project CCBQ000000000 data, contig 00106 n=1 Tax=Kluyveromyces dobzhanskii CBS 2104 TaxID=1427455 RepID=A0A0A8L8B1_9SACH|nr:unnamed protein product [Kluyveromyces dobzhanskii CBS 2104]